MTSKWQAIVETLMVEHRDNTAFQPFAAKSGVVSVDDAYAVQREYVSLAERRHGSLRAGYKIGLTSKAMQQMCGIDTPVSGVIFADRVVSAPAQMRRSDFGRLGLEFEIAIRIGRDLAEPEPTLSTAQVAEAVVGVAAAIELVDDRNCDYRTLDVLSLIADNAWNAAIVLGEFHKPVANLADVQGIVSGNGVEIGRGSGCDVLGHPFVPLTWLANRLIRDGSFLRAGDIVMTGSLIKTFFPMTPTRFDYTLNGIGQVSCEVS